MVAFLISGLPQQGPQPIRPDISSVDSAWLHVGLNATAKAYKNGTTDQQKKIYTTSLSLADSMDFSLFWSGKGAYISVDSQTGSPNMPDTVYDYPTEARLIFYIMAKQMGLSQGLSTEFFHDFIQGKYGCQHTLTPWAAANLQSNYFLIKGQRVLPSINGTVFERMMPWLVADDPTWNKELAVSDLHYVRSDPSENYPFTLRGASSCDDPTRGYREVGCGDLALMRESYEEDLSIVTPHAFYLALPVDPERAIQNLQLLYALHRKKQDPETGKKFYDPEYGWADAINIQTGRVSSDTVALDALMIQLAIANAAHTMRILPTSPHQLLKGYFAPVRSFIQSEHIFEDTLPQTIHSH